MINFGLLNRNFSVCLVLSLSVNFPTPNSHPEVLLHAPLQIPFSFCYSLFVVKQSYKKDEEDEFFFFFFLPQLRVGGGGSLGLARAGLQPPKDVVAGKGIIAQSASCLEERDSNSV
jgi:hypothetical protein